MDGVCHSGALVIRYVSHFVISDIEALVTSDNTSQLQTLKVGNKLSSSVIYFATSKRWQIYQHWNYLITSLGMQ